MRSLIAWVVFACGVALAAEPPDATPGRLMAELAQAMGTVAQADPVRLHAQVVGRLRSRFIAMLADPIAYDRTVATECGTFPEGRIYPYALPAMAFAQSIIASPKERQQWEGPLETLVDRLVPVVAGRLRAPDGDLLRIREMRKEGTHITTLGLTLGLAELAGNDRRRVLLDHVCDLLVSELAAKQGGPIDSYPTYLWPFDTVMALTVVGMQDRLRGRKRMDPLFARHFTWRREHNTDPATGLPRATPAGPPRGCDLTMQVCLLGWMAPSEALSLYRRMVDHHWLELGVMAGFSEWPKGVDGIPDIDSGPVVMGIGATATGMGLGAALAMGDVDRSARLLRELALMPVLLPHLVGPGGMAKSWCAGNVPMDAGYLTGFLYGDASMFFALTWTPLFKP